MNNHVILITNSESIKEKEIKIFILSIEFIVFTILILLLKLYLLFSILLVLDFILILKLRFLYNHKKDFIKFENGRLIYCHYYEEFTSCGNKIYLKKMKKFYTFNNIEKYYEKRNKFNIYGSITYKNIDSETGKIKEKFKISNKKIYKIFDNNKLIKDYLVNNI